MRNPELLAAMNAAIAQIGRIAEDAAFDPPVSSALKVLVRNLGTIQGTIKTVLDEVSDLGTSVTKLAEANAAQLELLDAHRVENGRLVAENGHLRAEIGKLDAENQVLRERLAGRITPSPQ